MATVGVIGLGRMGSAIARRLSAQGVSALGWTRSGRALDGIQTCPDVATLTAQSDVLVLSLFDDAAVAEVLDQLLSCDLQGKLIVETSTVTPDVLKQRIDRITDSGARAIDAPISGGPELVALGKCGIFVGGEPAAFARAQDVLSVLSDRVFHVGPLGAGLAMKVINNGMLHAYFNGLADLMPLAKASGLPLETALRILCGGPAGLPMVQDRIPKVLGDDPEVGFTILAARKDVGVFRQVVESYGLEAPMLARFQEITEEAIANGMGPQDPAALIRSAYDSAD